MIKKILPISIITTLIYANDFQTPSMYGFLGVANTPNAFTLKEGQIEFLYNNQAINLYPKTKPNIRNNTTAENYNLSIGLLPNLDMSLQYSYAYKNNSNSLGYLSDRSLSFKYQLPFFRNIVNIAIGGQDIGGGAQHLKSIYAVASKKIKNSYLSIGYAHGFNEGSLNGIFANFAYAPFSWLEVGGEYDTKEYNWVVKTHYKTHFYDTPLTVGAIYKNSFTYHKSYFATYVSLDFNSKLHKLKDNIEAKVYKKFANYSLKEDNNIIYYSFENNLFSNSDTYAMKEAIASLAKDFPNKQWIVVSLKKADLEILSLKVEPKKYLDFLNNGGKNPIVLADSFKSHSINNRDILKANIQFTPTINLVDGSEYGNLDYAFALNTTFYTHFAKGLIGALNLYTPLKVTENFKNRNVFAYRNRNKDKRY